MIKVRKGPNGAYQQLIEAGSNQLISDVPVSAGGDTAGFEPHDLLEAALGACTAQTVSMVARRKAFPLTDVRVEISRHEEGGVYRMERRIELLGDLSPEQMDYLMGIADKCPIHRALSGRFEIHTQRVAGP